MKFTSIAMGLAGLLVAGCALAKPGDLMPNWGDGGIKWTDSGFYPDQATGDVLVTTVVDSSARVYEVSIALGYSDDNTTRTTLVSRFLPNGAQDMTYGNDGWAQIALPEKEYHATAATMDRNGKLLVAGYFDVPMADDVMFLCRLDGSGKLDPTLTGLPQDHAGCTTNLGHPWIQPAQFDFSVGAILTQKDGKIVVVGDSGAYMVATRLNSNGTRDSAFGDQGLPAQYKGAIALPNWNPVIGGTVVDAKFAPDGAITIAASNTQDFFVIQLTANGSLNQNFGGVPKPGVRRIAFNMGGENHDAPSAIAFGAEGEIYVSGAVETAGGRQMGVVKLTSTGAIDVGFGVGGRAVPIVCDVCTDATADRMVLQNDGKIVLAGFVDFFTGEDTFTGDVGIVRLLANGSLDPTFGFSGSALFPMDVYQPSPGGDIHYRRAAQSLIPHNQGLLVGGSRWEYDAMDTFQINISLK